MVGAGSMASAVRKQWRLGWGGPIGVLLACSPLVIGCSTLAALERRELSARLRPAREPLALREPDGSWVLLGGAVTRWVRGAELWRSALGVSFEEQGRGYAPLPHPATKGGAAVAEMTPSAPRGDRPPATAHRDQRRLPQGPSRNQPCRPARIQRRPARARPVLACSARVVAVPAGCATLRAPRALRAAASRAQCRPSPSPRGPRSARPPSALLGLSGSSPRRPPRPTRPPCPSARV